MLARLFTYFIYQRRAKDYVINFANVSGKTTFNKWRKKFTTLSKICEKYGIDSREYLRFLVFNRGFGFYDVPKILDIGSFQLYAENAKIMEQHTKVYGWFMKSANYIVDECLKNNYGSCKEFLKRQILHNTLAEKMVSGKISIYYLSTIKNIREIVSKMDRISRDTFSSLVEMADKYCSDVQDAFMVLTSRKVNPMKFTDELLYKRQQNGYNFNKTEVN